MKARRLHGLPLLLLAFTVVSGANPLAGPAPAAEPRELTNLRAFARLYGVLRFFHPSDEAATLDWNRYAVLGVARVRSASDAATLEARLEALVRDIAPTVRILGMGEAAEPAAVPAGDELVSWQHLGPGFDTESTGSYRSQRTGLRAPPDGELFDERVAAGEVAVVDLGSDLAAKVPLAVWSRDGHTLPVADTTAMLAALDAVRATPADADARIADLIVAWSVFDQFYPYFDVTGTDWQAVLDRTLLDGLDDVGAEDHERTLRRLIAALEDGHGRLLTQGSELAALPLQLAWAEGQLVVQESATPLLARGDVITVVDGVPVGQALDAEMALQSGSPQWRRVRAIRWLGARPAGQPIVLRVLREDGESDVIVRSGEPPARAYAHPPIAQLDGDLWYLDLTRATPDDIAAHIANLARAPGVIFDMRGYPDETDGVLNHLLSKPDTDLWMHVARIVRPALPGAPRPQPAWDSRGWDLVPARPQIAGHVVFLADARAISRAESVMGYVEALRIDIVGSHTAGTNGNVRRVTLPTSATVAFTGMKVTRHDGSRSHLLGIRPTVTIEPTVGGIRAGRDEVLERAVALIRSGRSK